MIRGRLFLNGIVLFAISATIGWFVFFSKDMAWIQWPSFWYTITLLGGMVTLSCLCTGITLLFISTQRVPRHYSTFQTIRHFIFKYYRRYVGRNMLRKFLECCKYSRQQQETLLQEIIQKNKDTAYGCRFQLGSIKSLDDFRTKHPITEYNHYERFVDRIANREKNVMTTQKVSRLVLTSGTTGKSKRIPQDEYYVEKAFTLKEALIHNVYPNLQPMQSKLRYHCNAQLRRSEGGISMTSATALEPHMTRDMVVYCSPSDAFLIGTEYEASYIHLLFALRDKTLGSIWVTFISLFVATMKFLESNWRLIVDDLEKGTLNPDLKLSPDMCRSLTKALGSGDADRAAEIRREFEKGFNGIIKRLWPNCIVISTIDNVGLRQTVKGSVAKGVEMYSPFYISSENLLGLNLWPLSEEVPEYALNLAENVFEFIHEKDIDQPNPKTFFVDEVEVGQKYEIVFSQYYGLYRYRVGDVVEISGFYQDCPKVKVLYRKASLLNLVGEKVDQTVISDSIKAALSPWKDSVELSHYCVCESALLTGLFNDDREEHERTNLFYIFFLELNPMEGDNLPNDLKPNILSKVIDKHIYERHAFFQVFRDTKQISRPILYFVKKGSFVNLRESILANSSTSRAQFKMPLKLRTREMGELLLKHAKI